jgi:hypothetical protein
MHKRPYAYLWDGKGYHNVLAHTTGDGGKRLHNKGVYYQLKAACRREREGLLTATDGGVLAAATGSHVTSPGRRATA